MFLLYALLLALLALALPNPGLSKQAGGVVDQYVSLERRGRKDVLVEVWQVYEYHALNRHEDL